MIDWLATYESVRPLALFVLGVVIYSVFIFKFYRFVARRDVFKLSFAKYKNQEPGFFRKMVGGFFYILKYLIIFPICVFFWCLILTGLLAFLAKEQGIENILLVAVALVSAVRVTAYYTENLSQDLAKMMPFALLGVYLVNISSFSFSESIDLILQLPSMFSLTLNYLLFVVLLEFLLRVTYGIFGKKESKE